MTVPSMKLLRQLAARYDLPVLEDKAALDQSIKDAADQRRKARRKGPVKARPKRVRVKKQDRDYEEVMKILTKEYSITIEEFAEATKRPFNTSAGYLRRLMDEGVLTISYRSNKKIYYTLRTP